MSHPLKQFTRSATLPLRKFTLIAILRHYSWLITLLLIASIGAVIFYSRIFLVTTVLCTYDERPCRAELEAELNHLTGKNILLFRSDQIKEKLYKADAGVSQVSIITRLPHTVVVTLTSRISKVTISTGANAAQLTIDDKLMPFSITATPSAMPKITSSHASNLSLGQPISDPLLIQAVTLAFTLEKYFVPFDTIEAEGYHLTVLIKDGKRAIFPIDGNFPNLVTSLQLILRESTIQPPFSEVDLRFSKPVLR